MVMTPRFLVLIIVCMGCVNSQSFVQRDTQQGLIRGVRTPITDRGSHQRALEVFLGVPYAAPPVGDLRWRNPQPPHSWDDVRNATRFSPCCPQTLGNIRSWSLGPDYKNTDEDCLYLNIFSPRYVTDEGRQLPVMVWVHGGAYRFGSGEEYQGHTLAQEGDVVIVTINYRLGVLAFLSTDDEVAPGNFGLMDVIVALRWIRDNIAEFGGDPCKVTLFGNSAGGAAVSTMIFSKEAEGLFHRVIIQSGNALSPWAVFRHGDSILPHTEQLARAHGCHTAPSTPDMVDCLREVDPLDLVNTRIDGTTDWNAIWAPRVDGRVLTDLPENLLERGEFSRVPIFSGTVPDEVSDEYTGVPGIENGWPRAEREARIWRWTRRFPELQRAMVNELLLHEYDLPGDIHPQQRDLFLELRADNGYVAPHAKHAQRHADFVEDTFMYSWEHLSLNNAHPEWLGVPHLEETYYAFGTPLWGEGPVCNWECSNVVWFQKVDWTEEDRNISRDTMELWSTFARDGVPRLRGAGWPRYNRNTQHSGRMKDGRVETAGQQFYKYRRINFWNQLLEQLLNTTSPPSCTTIPPVVASAAYLKSHAHLLFTTILLQFAFKLLNN